MNLPHHLRVTLCMSTSIRRIEADDVDALFEAAAESVSEISPWMSWLNDEYTRAMADEWVTSREDAWSRRECFDFAIADENQRFLGVVGLNGIDLPSRRANFGYWVRTSAAGQGIATAAGRLLIDCVFAHDTPLPITLHRLEVVVAVGNQRSHRVARKLGAVREGVARARLWPNGSPQDAVIYSILASDARELQSDSQPVGR